MASTITTSQEQLVLEIKNQGLKLAKGHPLSARLAGIKPAKSPTQGPGWSAEIGGVDLVNSLGHFPRQAAVTFSVDQIEDHMVFSGQDNLWNLLTLVGDKVSILAGLENRELVGIFVELLNPTRSAPSSGYSIALGKSGLVALYAAIDRIRLMMFASMIERTGLQTLAFRIDDLQEQVSTGLKSADYRWLCATLESSIGTKVSSSKKLIGEGCTELVAAGLLTSVVRQKTAIFIPTPVLIDAALELLNPQPIMVLKGNGKTLGKDTTVSIFCGRSFWSMTRNQEQFRFGSIDGLDAIELINQAFIFDGFKDAGEAEAPNPLNDLNSVASHPTETDENSEPKATPRLSTICKNCGVELQPSKKFCSSCGTRR